MKKILVLSTGGTIASTEDIKGLKPTIKSDELLKYLNLKKDIEVNTLNISSIDSTDINPNHWKMIAKAIWDNYNDYNGFVVTHGTDTLAYTSAALSYMIQDSPKPIVITGAQKSIQMDITDAKTNLNDAVNYAAYDFASDVTVVFGGKVITGTRARKNRSKSFDAFTSINYPELGIILDNHFVDYTNIHKKINEPKYFNTFDTSVFLLKLFPGIETKMIDYCIENYKCIILESYGLGGIPIHLYEAIKNNPKAKERIFILTTQVTLEGSDVLIYEVGRRSIGEFYILESYDMTIEANISKCMWALGKSEGNLDIFKELYYTRINNDYNKNINF